MNIFFKPSNSLEKNELVVCSMYRDCIDEMPGNLLDVLESDGTTLRYTSVYRYIGRHYRFQVANMGVKEVS